jgi:16S rRNA G966 N2-methylase RsmD
MYNNIIRESIIREPIDISNDKNIKKELLFPKFINNDNINKLSISDIGLYSITKPNDAFWINNKILEIFGNDIKNKIITDGTACIGGDTIHFAQIFNNVNSIEINKVHYNMLLNNINIYNLKNVNSYNDDLINIVPKLKQNFLYLDPPWGGKNYKEKKYINLYLSNIPLYNIINMLIDYVSDAIIIKIPFNFDLNNFLFNLNIKYKFTFLKYNKFNLIFIIKS